MDNSVNNVFGDLLDVPHLRVTLITEDLLRLSFHADRSLLKVFPKTAPQALCELLEDLFHDAHVGLIYTVHTFGRDSGYKPHVHLATPKSGLKDNALQRWKLQAAWKPGRSRLPPSS